MIQVTGNILEVAEFGDVICHQVNCKKKAGAGLAKQIRTRWPAWYDAFWQRDAQPGDAALTWVEDGVWIADLYAQKGYGRDRPYTVPTAFAAALHRMLLLIRTTPDLDLSRDQLLVPYKIGCGLGGGAWPEIYAILQQVVPFAVIVQKD